MYVVARRSASAAPEFIAPAAAAETAAAPPVPLNALGDGESVRVPGSKSGQFYNVQRNGRTFACSCVGWRMIKGKAIELRSCKHIEAYNGEAYENWRLHRTPPPPKPPKQPKQLKTPKAKKSTAAAATAAPAATTDTATSDVSASADTIIAVDATTTGTAIADAIVTKPKPKRATKPNAKPAATASDPDASDTAIAPTTTTDTAPTTIAAAAATDAPATPPKRRGRPRKTPAPATDSTTTTTTTTSTDTASSAAAPIAEAKATKPKAKRATTKVASAKAAKSEEQIESGAAASEVVTAAEGEAPALLLAKTWDGEEDLSGWWVSEKLDGVRAFWNGRALISRLGNRFHAPDWFVAGLPRDVVLDGELFGGRDTFQSVVGIAKTTSDGAARNDDDWKRITFHVFDLPAQTDKPFESRMQSVKQLVSDLSAHNPYIRSVTHTQLPPTADAAAAAVRAELDRVCTAGGEGLMCRRPHSLYEPKRSSTLLKVKRFEDTEAIVIDHVPGNGKYKGLLGALTVQLANGKQFRVGTGLSDADRALNAAPKIGAIITVRYQGTSKSGVPRFPVFAGQRFDVKWAPAAVSATAAAAAGADSTNNK